MVDTNDDGDVGDPADPNDGPGEFFDPFARVYDARLRETRDETAWVGDDVAFYRDLARDADGPALEVGVGTGRVYLEVLADGHDVDGIDLSEGMLDRLRSKAADRGLDPSVRIADVTGADFDREYGLVYAPARAFNHLATLDDQRAALRSIRDALRPGGTLALNTFVPSFEIVAEEYGTPREESVTVGGDTYRVVTTSTLTDEVEQVSHIRRELYRDGDLVAKRETPLALIPKRQFELCFELAGFDEWQVYGGFDYESLESTDQEMVWIATV